MFIRKSNSEKILAKSLQQLDDLLLESDLIIDESLLMSKSMPATPVIGKNKTSQRVVIQKDPQRNRLVKALNNYASWNQANTLTDLNPQPATLMTKSLQEQVEHHHLARACRNQLKDHMDLLAKSGVPAAEAVQFQKAVEDALNNANVDAGLVMSEMNRMVKERVSHA